MVRRTDRPAMTIAVDLGRKATKQTKITCVTESPCISTLESFLVKLNISGLKLQLWSE